MIPMFVNQELRDQWSYKVSHIFHEIFSDLLCELIIPFQYAGPLHWATILFSL